MCAKNGKGIICIAFRVEKHITAAQQKHVHILSTSTMTTTTTMMMTMTMSTMAKEKPLHRQENYGKRKQYECNN